MTRLIDAQERWARPLGARGQRWLRPLFDRWRGAKDVLNGTWLGHPLHPSLVAVPIGTLTLMLVLDVIGQDVAADVALGLALLALVATAISGSADAVDLQGRPRTAATVHAATMVLATLLLLLSFLLRLIAGDDRGLAVVLGFAGYAVLVFGGYVGGELTYTLGAGVNRHAWRERLANDWQAIGAVEIADGKPVRVEVRGQTMVLVRDGEAVHALLETCAHAGGPLSKGRVVDGCIECPWHQSRFDLRDGRVRKGPSVYDQPTFGLRRVESGEWEIRESSTT
ncbi:MAG: Rieske (2Fe-2S) protein [Candidatus Limnocylindrales bacterium]